MNCSLEHLALPSVLCSGLSECRSLPKSFSAPQSVPLWLRSLLCMPKENGSSYLMFQTVPPRKTPSCKLSGVSKTPTGTSLQISEETSLLDQLKNACGFILRIGSLIRGLKNLLTLFDVSHCLDLKKKTLKIGRLLFGGGLPEDTCVEAIHTSLHQPPQRLILNSLQSSVLERSDTCEQCACRPLCRELG